MSTSNYEMSHDNVFTALKASETISLKLRFFVVILSGLFFYSAGIFIFLQGLSTLMLAPELTTLGFLHVLAMAVPPVLIGTALVTLQYWAIYILAAHALLAVAAVLPLLYFDLGYLVPSTLLNNGIIVVILAVVWSLRSLLCTWRYGLLVTTVYILLLAGTSGVQIYYRLLV